MYPASVLEAALTLLVAIQCCKLVHALAQYVWQAVLEEDQNHLMPLDAGAPLAQPVQDWPRASRAGDRLEQPVQETGLEQPVQETGLEQPVQETGLEQPVQETGLIQPVQETGLEQPVQETGLIQPVQETGAPLAGNVFLIFVLCSIV